MALPYKIIELFILGVFVYFFSNCNFSTQNKNLTEYELAEDYLTQLRNYKTDTIIFYKRTCINCCDFYNIFWTSNGNAYLKKFYPGNGAYLPKQGTFRLKNSHIFNELSKLYSELKYTSIKGNGHKNEDGSILMSAMDHDCYTQIKIFTPKDSIQTSRIEDHDFDKFIGFDEREKSETNDNYLYNLNSKWNLFLTQIETELASMKETGNRELQTLRTRNTKK